jgi:Uma2 family endonuclease
MAIRTPTLSVDDQEYYPLHEEDDVPETPPHEATARYVRDALAVRFRDWLVTGNVCIYWERGNTRDYRAPEVLAVKEPLAEPVRRNYQLWKQPSIAFVMEVGSRTTLRKDVGPKVELYEAKIRAREYYHVDLDRGVQRLWRLGATGYEEIAPEPNGRLRSQELELEFVLEADGLLRIYTLEGEPLLTHEETAERLEATEEQLEATEERLTMAERQAAEEAQRRQEAERRAEEEAARRAELERQLAALQVRLADREPEAGA